MKNSCNLIAKVKNSNGEETTSLLHSDLLQICKDRNTANDLYLKCINKNFIEKYKSYLDFDKNGQPTIGSLVTIVNMHDYLLNFEKIAVNSVTHTKPVTDNTENFNELLEEVIKFNNESRFRKTYSAVIQKSTVDGMRFLNIKVVPSNTIDAQTLLDYEKTYKLNAFIRERLAKAGFDVTTFDELEQEIKYNGVTDFTAAKNATSGLVEIIKVAQGSKGETVLPEEFAHFLLGCLRDTDEVETLQKFFKSQSLVRLILGEEYEKYNEVYKNNEEKLALEAIAHVLKDYLLEGILPENTSNYTDRLIAKLIESQDSFEDLFSRLDAKEISDKLDEIDEVFKNIVKYALDDKAPLKLKSKYFNELWYNLGNNIKAYDELLQQAIEIEAKRKKLYASRAKNPKKFRTTQNELIEKLSKAKEGDESAQLVGIFEFVKDAHSKITLVLNKFNNIDAQSLTLKDKAELLNNILQYVNSYSQELQDICDTILNKFTQGDLILQALNMQQPAQQTLNQLVTNCILSLNSLKNQISRVAIAKVVIPFFQPYFGDSITNPFTNETINLEDLITKSQKDISYLNAMLSSMANSSDWINKLFAKVVAETNTQIRYNSTDYEKQIQAIGLKAVKYGITDFDYMYEKDDQGDKTLRFISYLNWGQYNKDKKEFERSQDELFGANRNNWSSDVWDRYKTNKEEWHKIHSIYVDPARTSTGQGYYRPNDQNIAGKKNYVNAEYNRLSAKQKEILNDFMKIKHDLDALISNGSQQYMVPVVLKDTLERLSSAKSTKALGMTVVESLKDEIMRRSDDAEFGSNIKTDFNNKEVETLPIYYQSLRNGENANDVSTDIVSTLSAYAYMACRFKGFNDILDCLELSRYVVDQNDPLKTDGSGNTLMSKLRTLEGSIEQNVLKSSNNAKLQRDNWFAAQVYGKYYKDLGSISVLGMELDWNKLADLSNKITAISGLGFNIPAGIVNIEQGLLMANIEKAAKQFFTNSNLLQGDKVYAELIPAFLAQIGCRVKTDTLSLMDEKFDCMQSYDKEIKDVGFDRNNWFKKMFGTDFVFFISNAGENWLQHRTFFALEDNDEEKLLDGDKKVKIMTEACEKKWIQPDGSLGNVDAGLGAKLVMKKGLKTQDGKTIITNEEIKHIQKNGTFAERAELKRKLNSNDFIEEYKVVNAFSRKAKAINHRLHGIYNNEDMNAFQRHAVGRMVMIFRKWIVPSVQRRYAGQNYNFDLEDWTEGYYRTFFRVIGDIRRAKFHIAEVKDKLTDVEKQNVKRAERELSIFALLLGGLMLLSWKGGDDDDDKEKTYIENVLTWNLLRLRTELGVLLPAPTMISESLKIIKMPSADVNTWDNITNTLGLLNPWNYPWNEDAIIKSGRFKGHSKAYKLIRTNCIVAPFDNDLRHILHPEEMIPFYK